MVQDTTVAESFLEELKRFAGFGKEDEAALRLLHPCAAPHFRQIASDFYDRISEFEAASAVVASDAQIDRLKVTMRAWLDRLLRGPWGENYFELRSRIGRVHVQVRLPQRYMLSGAAFLQARLTDIAFASFAAEPEVLCAMTRAVSRVMSIDLAIMLQTYRHDSLEQVRRYERMEKELLQRRLAISETRYREIIENAGVMMIAADNNDRIVLFNHEAEKITEHKRGEVLGKQSLAALCHPESRDLLKSSLKVAHAGKAPPAIDARMLTRGGSERWVRIHVTKLAAPAGSIAAIIGMDITDERELEQRTRRAERLAGLGTLAAGLAHEIRNPLNSALLQLTLVERRLQRPSEDGTAKALTGARVIRDEMKRLAGLVQDFLAFARPRELRVDGGDLCETVQAVLGLLSPEIDSAEVEISTDFCAPVAARYDNEQIKQVLLNLIHNAMQAAGAGGHVEVSVFKRARSAFVEISDSGHGPPDEVDIFAPFTTNKDGGTGLGLPIVHRIVTDHGGEISWRRDKEHTIFAVELPVDGPVRRARG